MGTNGDFWGLMGTKFYGDYRSSKTIDVIPQVPKSSHYLPPPSCAELLEQEQIKLLVILASSYLLKNL